MIDEHHDDLRNLSSLDFFLTCTRYTFCLPPPDHPRTHFSATSNYSNNMNLSRFLAVRLLLVSLFATATAFAPCTGTGTCTRSPTARLDRTEGMSAEDREIAMDKATKAMTAFTNKYLQNTGTSLCTDKSVPAVVIKGLAEHKVTLGAPLCPCRFYEDKEAEAKDGYWNCPCVPMRERHECHCMLFLTEDNPFAGSEQEIGYDEVVDFSKGMS